MARKNNRKRSVFEPDFERYVVPDAHRWHVYEHLKQTYMFSGKVPTREAIFAKFVGRADPEEIEEGIAEFVLTVQHFVPSIRAEQVVETG